MSKLVQAGGTAKTTTTAAALNERRVLPKAEKSIIRHAQNGLFSGLKAADYLKYDGAWPPPAERVLPFMHGLIGPRGWSCTELSRVVELPLRMDRPGRREKAKSPLLHQEQRL